MSRRFVMLVVLAVAIGAGGVAYRYASTGGTAFLLTGSAVSQPVAGGKGGGVEAGARAGKAGSDKAGSDRGGIDKAGAGKASAGKGRRETGPIPVVTAKVQRRDLPVEFSSVGRAEAPQTVSLRSRVDGVIKAIHFTPGQTVRRGALLVELDARQIAAQLRQVEGNLARDEANLVKAKADLARYTDLASRNFVAASAVDAYRAAVQAAQATVDVDRAGVEYARVQLEHTRILAPMDGVAGALQVFPGANVKANDTAIVTVNQLRPILVAFGVPQAQLPGLRDRLARGDVVVSGSARDSAQPTRQGRLVFIDNAIDASTGTITLKARFDIDDTAWTPGQFVNVSLVSRVIRDALTVPVEAVQMGPSGNFAFLVRDGRAEMRPVRAFTVAGSQAVLEGGFEAGDRLVVDGQMRLTPGAMVRERAPGAARADADGQSVKSIDGGNGAKQRAPAPVSRAKDPA